MTLLPLAFAVAVAGEEPQAADSVVLQPGVVADPSGGRLFVLNRARETEAIDHAGATLWKSKVGARPLLLWKSRLVAQAPFSRDQHVDLVAFDAKTGELVGRVLIPFTAALRTLSERRTPGELRLDAVARRGDLFVRWVFREVWGKGTAPPPTWRPVVHSGAWRVDLEKGTSEQVEEKGMPADPSELEVARLRLDATPALPPRKGTEGLWAVVRATDDSPGAGRIVRWEVSGKRLGDLALEQLLPKGQRWEAKVASSDGRHLLASAPIDLDAYQWVVIDPISEKIVFQGQRESAAAPFVMLDAALVELTAAQRTRSGDSWVDTPPQVRGSSGSQTWSRDLLEPGEIAPPPGSR